MALDDATSYITRAYKVAGFTKAYNFWLWFLLSLGLGSFTLLRIPYLNLRGNMCGSASGGEDGAVPGECFYYLQPGRYQLGILVHLACVLPASLLALTQFMPPLRRRALRLHRFNGYASVALSLVGAVAAVVISRRSMNGGLDTQSMVGLLAIIFFFSTYKGVISARRHQIEQHRAWMLRAWVMAGAIVTMRFLIGLFVIILSTTGGYYYAEPCAKLDWVLKGENATLARFPECAPFFSGQDLDRHVAVPATVANHDEVEAMAIINLVFGSSGWTAIAMHAIGVELYLRLTSNEKRTAKSVKLQQNGVNGALKAE